MRPGSQSEQLIGTVLQGTYTLERLLGAGGMGAVYEASHTRLQRRFAVKVLSPEVASIPEAVSRFRREAEISSGLGHPHIIEVIDFNTDDQGHPYIIMELLEGEDLAARLVRGRRLPLDAIVHIVQQVASALTAAHTKGVIHRDLKPSNIFICRQADGREVVKVVDFGISKVVGAASVLTQTQASMGTPSYMSPEQAEGRSAQVSAQTDVFALGTIVFEMLTGAPPFVADMIPAMLYKICHAEPPSICENRPDVPAAVEQVVFQALSKAPEERFASATAMSQALATAAGIALASTTSAGLGSSSPDAATAPPDGAPGSAPQAATDPSLVGAVAASTTLTGSAGEVHKPPTPTAQPTSIPGGKRGLQVAIVASVLAGLGTVGLVAHLLTRGATPLAHGDAGVAAARGEAVDRQVPVDAGTPPDVAPPEAAPQAKPDAGGVKRPKRPLDAGERRGTRADARAARARTPRRDARVRRRPPKKKEGIGFW